MTDSLEILDTPMYTVAEAGRLTKLHPSRIRRWLRGYPYKLTDSNGGLRTMRQKPLVERQGTVDSIYASFLDVIDLLFIKEFLQADFTLQFLRKAFEDTKKLTGSHHFAQSVFFVERRKIFVQTDKIDGKSVLVELLTNGQVVLDHIVKQYAKKIDFDKFSDFAERWHPLGKNKNVIIDPRISFGRPTVKGYGVTTDAVYDLYLAENKNIKLVGNWFSLQERDVIAVVEFEKWLKAA